VTLSTWQTLFSIISSNSHPKKWSESCSICESSEKYGKY